MTTWERIRESRFVEWLAITWIRYRNYGWDLWRILFNLPLYYRCAKLWSVRDACFGVATWTYVPTKRDRNDQGEPQWCDHCASDLGVEDMKRVGPWYRTAAWIHDRETMKRIHRPAPEIQS